MISKGQNTEISFEFLRKQKYVNLGNQFKHIHQNSVEMKSKGTQKFFERRLNKYQNRNDCFIS